MADSHTTDLLLVSPMFFGDVGGAAVYYRLLANALLERGFGVDVISDRETGSFAGTYHGLFPARCGADRRAVRDLFAYGSQNLDYLRLPGFVRRSRPRVLLVHTSFLNFPGLFPKFLGWLKRRRSELGVRLVADVRDRLLPGDKVPLLAVFDAVIACSESIADHLATHGLERDRIDVIPVPQEPVEVDAAAADARVGALGLESTPYVLYGGLLKESKGVDLLLESFLEHVLPQRPACRLVLSGLFKATGNAIPRMLERPGVIYAGNQSRQGLLELMSRAAVCVNLSPREGLPRVSLEALALERPAILPPGVPEFARHCGEFVVASRDPAVVGERILELLDSGRVPVYPIARHSIDAVLPRYLEVLSLSAT